MYVNLEGIRNFDADRADINDLVALYTFAKALGNTYTEFTLDLPEWLKDNLEAMKKAINQMREDELQRALKNVESRLEALKTSAEKREDLAQELARIKAALGRS